MKGEINYRNIIRKEIDEGICWCCKKIFNKIYVHHINWKHKDDHPINLICVCQRCHIYIHKGFRNKVDLSEDNIYRIQILRKVGIKKVYGKDTDDFLKYEMALASNVPLNKGRCYKCGSKKNVKLIPPKFVLKFDKHNRKRIGIPFCNQCLKH